MENKKFEDFFFRKSLYDPIGYFDTEFIIEDILLFEGKITGYCPRCQKNTIYVRADIPFNEFSASQFLESGGYTEIHLKCIFDDHHQIVVCLMVDAAVEDFQKIGQYPSIASLAKNKFKRYRKILGEQQLKELNTAVGLESHGVGIGAFVYLRRLFENLIAEAHEIQRKLSGWNESDYLKSRMDEKINILKDNLPSKLVEIRSMYGILSKGIHELSEEECLRHFPLVLSGIDLILAQKLEQKEQEQRNIEITQQLEKLSNELRK